MRSFIQFLALNKGIKQIAFFRLMLISTVVSAIFLMIAGCASYGGKDAAPPPEWADGHPPDAVPKAEPPSRYGNPASYTVKGKRYYVLKTTKGYDKTGKASWYGTKFHGRLTSTREPYDMHAMTAASPNLPIPSYVRVTNLDNGRSVVVKVNDRGPFKSDRIIDLSYAAAKKLGYINKGVGHVRVTAIDTTNQQTILASNKQHDAAVKKQVKVTSPPPTQKMETVQLAQNTTSPVYLQVGAFKNHDAALSMREKVAKLIKMDVSIKESNHKDQPIYLVKVGPLIDDEISNKIRAELAENGFEKPLEVKG